MVPPVPLRLPFRLGPSHSADKATRLRRAAYAARYEKAWLDRILVAGKTFAYSENGPQGLATGKRVIIALARGGFYNEGSPAAAFEYLESYLTAVFNFIGIQPEFVAADGLAISPEQREQSIQQALGETVRLAA